MPMEDHNCHPQVCHGHEQDSGFKLHSILHFEKQIPKLTISTVVESKSNLPAQLDALQFA